jgi:hypothetical protein
MAFSALYHCYLRLFHLLPWLLSFTISLLASLFPWNSINNPSMFRPILSVGAFFPRYSWYSRPHLILGFAQMLLSHKQFVKNSFFTFPNFQSALPRSTFSCYIVLTSLNHTLYLSSFLLFSLFPHLTRT